MAGASSPMAFDELLQGFPVVITLNVAWGDMDAFQHVNNTRIFRLHGRRAHRLLRAHRHRRPERSAAGHRPDSRPTRPPATAPRRPRYPDEVQVGARVVSVGQHSFKMEYRVVSVALHKTVATGSAVVVAYDYIEERKALLPDAWQKALSGVEGCDLSVPRALSPDGDDEG